MLILRICILIMKTNNATEQPAVNTLFLFSFINHTLRPLFQPADRFACQNKYITLLLYLLLFSIYRCLFAQNKPKQQHACLSNETIIQRATDSRAPPTSPKHPSSRLPQLPPRDFYGFLILFTNVCCCFFFCINLFLFEHVADADSTDIHTHERARRHHMLRLCVCVGQNVQSARFLRLFLHANWMLEVCRSDALRFVSLS